MPVGIDGQGFVAADFACCPDHAIEIKLQPHIEAHEIGADFYCPRLESWNLHAVAAFEFCRPYLQSRC